MTEDTQLINTVTTPAAAASAEEQSSDDHRHLHLVIMLGWISAILLFIIVLIVIVVTVKKIQQLVKKKKEGIYTLNYSTACCQACSLLPFVQQLVLHSCIVDLLSLPCPFPTQSCMHSLNYSQFLIIIIIV